MNNNQQAALFKEWLGQYARLMARVARAYTASEADCQDLLQGILFPVWRSIPSFRREASPSTWVYRVALNTALSVRRRERQRWRFLPLSDLPEVGDPGGERMPDQESIESLYAAIRRLPKPDAALVILYLDDLSYRQMAEVLGISETNVGVKLNRVRKALAEKMREVAHETGS